MKIKTSEVVVMVCLAALSIWGYLGKIYGWHHGFQFPTWLSAIVLALTALSLAWILFLTIGGKMIERRIVFLYVGVAIALPLFMSIKQEIPVSAEVRAVYDELVKLPAGSKVLVSFDYDPASAPELQPQAEAFVAECFARDLKVIIMGLWPQGPQQANLAVDRVLQRPEFRDKNIQYGIDWVNLGYQAGGEFVIQRMGTSFQSMFKSDYRGVLYEDLPLVKNVKNFSAIDYSMNLSSGFPGTPEWVQVAVDRYGLRMGAGNTAVQAPTVYPYLGTQLIGLMGGMSGGAEFEQITGRADKASRFMLSQSLAHLIVVAFIIIGNVAFFRSGRKSALKG